MERVRALLDAEDTALDVSGATTGSDFWMTRAETLAPDGWLLAFHKSGLFHLTP